MKKNLILIFCLISKYSLFSQSIKLTTPLEGIYLKDYFIVNYVDIDTSKNTYYDHSCGTKTYDNHMGTDFTLRSFKQMDSGVKVLAAADGKIINLKASLFDRNKSTNNLELGNYIAIAHKNNYYTYYGHLKKNSLLVNIGDSVKAGQALALVGSSGNSTDPHLHFEIWYDSLYYFDPFNGGCQTFPTFWNNQLSYDSSVQATEHGLLNFITTIDTLRERPESKFSFNENDSFVAFWQHLTGVKNGDSLITEWYTPQGDLYYRFAYKNTFDYWYYYYYTYIFRPQKSGVYSYKFYLNKIKINEGIYTVNLMNGLNLLSETIPMTFYNNSEYISWQNNENLYTDFNCKIVDIQGRILMEKQTKNFINIDHLAKGIYWLLIEQNNQTYTHKFFK
ncbi:MAG: peptidoglycan DD-metalloendopeptidase family protein [Bacteroidetes bacterium]|nr:peptidoglycan DD-metalloendopeptidase family protein [Bacteroidota bacterium]